MTKVIIFLCLLGLNLSEAARLAPLNSKFERLYAEQGTTPLTGFFAPPIYTKRYNPAIQMVVNPDGASGTGFFVKSAGRVFLVTAAHVCGSSKVLFSEKGLHEVLAIAPERDTCILSTYQNVQTLSLASKDSSLGDWISTIGFPMRLEWDYSKGHSLDVGLSRFALPYGYYGGETGCPKSTQTLITPTGLPFCGVSVTTIAVKMLVRPGNSGGPAINFFGNVVGIVIGTDLSTGTGYIVPLSEFTQILERI